MLCKAEPLDFGALSKHPNEVLRVLLDFGPNLTRYREPGRLYRAGDTVRPRVPTGWAYEAVADGTTAHHEPLWRVGEGQLTRDGSVQWRAVPALYAAVDIITSATWAFDSAGATISGASWQGSELNLLVQGGSDGAEYQVTVNVTTLSGQTLVGVFVIQIATQRIE